MSRASPPVALALGCLLLLLASPVALAGPATLGHGDQPMYGNAHLSCIEHVEDGCEPGGAPSASASTCSTDLEHPERGICLNAITRTQRFLGTPGAATASNTMLRPTQAMSGDATHGTRSPFIDGDLEIEVEDVAGGRDGEGITISREYRVDGVQAPVERDVPQAQVPFRLPGTDALPDPAPSLPMPEARHMPEAPGVGQELHALRERATAPQALQAGADTRESRAGLAHDDTSVTTQPEQGHGDAGNAPQADPATTTVSRVAQDAPARVGTTWRADPDALVIPEASSTADAPESPREIHAPRAAPHGVIPPPGQSSQRNAQPLTLLPHDDDEDAPAPRHTAPAGSGPAEGESVETKATAPHPAGNARVILAVLATLTALALIALPVAALYHRIQRGDLLGQRTRRRIFEAVAARPGLTTQEAAQAAGVSYNTTDYHLRRLAQAGMVARDGSGRQARYVAAGASAQSARPAVAAALAQEEVARVYRAAQQAPGATKTDLSRALGVSRATIKWHVKRLLAAGLLEERREGREVRVFALSA